MNELHTKTPLSAEDRAAILFNRLIDTEPASVCRILTERLSGWWSGSSIIEKEIVKEIGTPIIEKRAIGRPRQNAGSVKAPYVNWSELLPLLPTRFTAHDVHELPQCTYKRSSEIYAGIIRWVRSKQVKAVSRGVYEKLSSPPKDHEANRSLLGPLLKSKPISPSDAKYQVRHHRDEYVALMRDILGKGDLTVEDLCDRIDREWGAGASYGMFQFRTAVGAKVYTNNGHKWWGLKDNNVHAA